MFNASTTICRCRGIGEGGPSIQPISIGNESRGADSGAGGENVAGEAGRGKEGRMIWPIRS